MSRRRGDHYWVHSDPEAPPESTKPESEPCPGVCNRRWRRWQKEYDEEVVTAVADNRPPNPALIEKLATIRPVAGAPVWCAECREEIRRAIDVIPERTALAGARRDGQLNASTRLGRKGRSEPTFSPSGSPAWDLVDETITWASDLADQLARHLNVPGPIKAQVNGLPRQNLVRACSFLSGHVTALLSTPFAVRAGQRTLYFARHLELASGRDQLVHQLYDPEGNPLECKLCGRKALVRDDGSDRVRCRFCKHTWPESHYPAFVSAMTRGNVQLNDLDEDDVLLTIAQAAEQYKLKPMTIRRWVERGLLDKHHIGRLVAVVERDLIDVEYTTRQHPSGQKRAS